MTTSSETPDTFGSDTTDVSSFGYLFLRSGSKLFITGLVLGLIPIASDFARHRAGGYACLAGVAQAFDFAGFRFGKYIQTIGGIGGPHGCIDHHAGFAKRGKAYIRRFT